jgi:hypothetical protein
MTRRLTKEQIEAILDEVEEREPADVRAYLVSRLLDLQGPTDHEAAVQRMIHDQSGGTDGSGDPGDAQGAGREPADRG